MDFCMHIFQKNGTESCIKCGSKKPLNFKEWSHYHEN